MNTEDFYGALPREKDFARLTDPSVYHAIPGDWHVGVADVAGSTAHVAAGRYKTVNMVGAAVISALMNAGQSRSFPFVFGGDGAGFAIGPDGLDAAEKALRAVSRWALDEFRMNLRVALVPVTDVRRAGHDLRVARFQVSEAADYAMFTGGGMLWAERQMKAGAYMLDAAPGGVVPDLTGLSCRWAHMPARHGTILSLVVAAEPSADPRAVARAFRAVIEIAGHLDRGGHPAPETGMVARRASKGARLEGHVTRGHGSLALARIRAATEAGIYWLLYHLRMRIGGFDARHFAHVVAHNADFRKLDDGLKMTLDCDPETRRALETLLSRAARDGLLRYGIATQDEAMMTCIVPSALTDDHLHFIDGASGGYTLAASRMKSA